VLVVLSIVMAVVPMVGMLLLIWWTDRYHREPLWLFGLTFLWGGIGGVIFALIGNTALDITLTPVAFLLDQAANSGQAFQIAIGPTIVAPLVEEPAKAIILLVIITSRQFDNITDGFVYGAAAGLGFGMTENALYFLSVVGDSQVWFDTVAIRTAFSAVMHGTATAMVGAGLGWGRFRGWPGMLVGGTIGMGLALSLHAMWNGLLTMGATTEYHAFLSRLDLFLLPIIVAIVIACFQLSLFVQSRTILRELTDEARLGTLPLDHARIVASWFKRQRYTWVPEGVDHRRYVDAATTLALRKYQCRLPRGRRVPFYQDDVLRLRKQIKAMLEHSKWDGDPD
jgi:RsiW-degrading membrane proteinase PrsW (M82 family)